MVLLVEDLEEMFMPSMREATITVNWSRVQRDTLRGFVSTRACATASKAFPEYASVPEDRTVALESADQAREWLGLLDCIGWEVEGSAEQYTVDLDGRQRELFLSLEDEVRLTYEYDHQTEDRAALEALQSLGAIETGGDTSRIGLGQAIVVDRETRDLIVDQIRSHETPSLEGFHETLRCGDHEEVQSELAKAQWIIERLDELGWMEAGDRETYSLTVDEQLQRWADGQLSGLREGLSSDRDHLARIEAGGEGWYWPGCSQSESEQLQRQLIAKDEHQVSVLARLVGELALLLAVRHP